MKTRFNTYDIVCSVSELQRLVGMRVNQVYDIDNKAYLIRLQRSEEKSVLLLESANRFHTTQFEWPKNVAPSGFTMKLRKHLKNKRLEKLSQIGIDRIVDMQFGTGEAAYHVILELYDRGNIVLTDHELTILNVLRPHVEGDKIKFAVKEKYPLDRAKMCAPPPTGDALRQILANSKPGDNLKKILNPNLEYGPGIIDHILAESGLAGSMRIVAGDAPGFNVDRDFDKLEQALALGEQMLQAASNNVAKGYIIQKKEERPNPTGDGSTYLLTNQEFHPFLYAQHRNQPYQEYDTFDRAVDEFFSMLEGQKIDLKAIQVEREAMKKLQNVKKDHDKRLTELERVQCSDRQKAELITRNQTLVDNAILAIRSALANQMSWDDIRVLVKNAQANQDPVASSIKHLKLESNHITLYLTDPYISLDDSGDDDDADGDQGSMKPMLIDVDLALTAYANARRYYDQKRNAAVKQQKTLDAQGKAFKSAERKTKQTLKEVQTITSINKARKLYWFEKFFWFISSENYLVIGGRDQQQNELLVKRYMRAGDVYVHADVSGASSIIIKNPTGAPVPPKTLNEAGQVAIAYSVAWDAKVLTSAWWVHAAQVSKSAPTGEYLSTGSFMIRGKKNYLLPSHLMLGFSFMFRLEDGSIERHKDERRVLGQSEEQSEAQPEQEDQEIIVSDEDEESVNDRKKLESITEQMEQTEIDIDNPNVKIEIQDRETGEREEREDTNERDSDSSQSSDEVFPDTHIKVDHGSGKVIIESKTRTISELTSDSQSDSVFLGDDKPLSFPSLPQKNEKGVAKHQGGKKGKEVPKEQPKKDSNGLKRGQKSKLKKIKKYKDQDEEERQAWIEQLHSVSSPKDSKKAQKKQAVQNAIASGSSVKGKGKGQQRIPMPAPLLLEGDEDDVVDNEGEAAAPGPGADVEMLSQLTGCPLPEDELLFAVPVIAPYSVLNNYKFKVKLTPGTGKRGKAAKTAIQVFLKDKSCSPRERDLLKAVKDEDIARNFPGKVKLSAPQLQKHKK